MDRHLEGSDRQVAIIDRADRPAHAAPRVQIQNGRQGELATARRHHLGRVADPSLVRALGLEAAFKHVGRDDASRQDFIALVRALGHRGEQREILDSVGATILGGFNNWDRVASLRRAWGADSPTPSPVEWAERWREIVREPSLYQDRFIILSSGPYSGASAADVGLSDEEWARCSITLRLEHECTHYFTRRVLGAMRNRLADELIADAMGIVAATGRFRADWLLRFLGLEHYPTFRPGGRLEEYRGNLALNSGSFRVLCSAAQQCARNLEAIDQLRPPWTRSPDSSADKAEMILALAAIGLEGLAAPSAVDLYLAARRARSPYRERC